jgi:hypothetical protein
MREVSLSEICLYCHHCPHRYRRRRHSSHHCERRRGPRGTRERTGCLLGLRPGNRLIARHPLLVVHVRLDQACVDRKPLAGNQPSRYALRHHALEYPAQGIALAKAFVPCAAEHRMVGYTVLDTELAEPTIGMPYFKVAICGFASKRAIPFRGMQVSRRTRGYRY